jgi:quercetin dioxygenase-like cupin family protein
MWIYIKTDGNRMNPEEIYIVNVKDGVIKMNRDLFPEPVLQLPEADIPLDGVNAYLSQGNGHQIIFMHFDRDIDLPEHEHAAQWGIVLEGRIDLAIGGVMRTYIRGDRYFIPPNVPHFGRIYAGYADMTFFAQPDRYPVKTRSSV